MTTTIKILNSIYVFIILFFLLDLLTSIEIKSQALKSFVYYGSLIGTPLILILNFVLIKTKTMRIIGLVYPTIVLTTILFLNPIAILFSTGAWQTQTIIYENGHMNFKKIELQMQDIGARGYKERTVEVTYLTPIFMVVSHVPKQVDKAIEWIKADIEVNELGIKYP